MEDVERLARELAGDVSDALALDWARSIAEAELALAQIRRVKVALIERLRAFGELAAPQPVYPRRMPWRLLEAMMEYKTFPVPPDAASTMPKADDDRTAEAIRRLLPELVRLHRYERRAVARRRRLVRLIAERKVIDHGSKR